MYRYVRAFAMLTAILCAGTAVEAFGYTVNRTDDTGDGICDATCTLRDAVTAANASAGQDTIDFAPSLTTVELANEIAITNPIRILGPGANKLTINGGSGSNRIFYITATATISGVTLTGGEGGGANDPGFGGAINKAFADLTLDRVEVTGNSADVGGGIRSVGGSLILQNSTVTSNVAAINGGGISASNAGNISGLLRINNSSVVGNTATQEGGGVYLSWATGFFMDARLTNSTITSNNAQTAGGGLSTFGENIQVTVANTILAGNSAPANPEWKIFLSATVTSSGNNLVGDSAGDANNTGAQVVTFQASDILNINPQFGSFGYHGGGTQTMSLLPASPAIDHGNNTNALNPIGNPLTSDQRTVFSRTVDGDVNGTATVDIGSYEFVPPASEIVVNQGDDNGDGVCDPATCTLREAIALANSEPTDQTIRVNGGLVTPLNSEIVINNTGNGNLTIIGPTGIGTLVTVDGGPGTNRIFSISGVNVTIAHLKLSGGEGTGATNSGFGGAVYASGGTLTLDDVYITGNTADIGGGVYSSGNILKVSNSTLSNNSAGNCGGGLDAGPGTTAFAFNTTFTGNSAVIGGAICNEGSTTLRNVTISSNTATSNGGGIFQIQATLNFGNSIIAGNTNAATPELFTTSLSSTTSAGNNLVGDSAGDSANTNQAIGYLASDIRDTDPRLGPLQINGGLTPTRGLLAGSPAIDKGSNAVAVDPQTNIPLAVDERGANRYFDGDFNGSNVVDIGAFERNATPTAARVTLSGQVLTADGYRLSRIIVSIVAPDGSVRTAQTSTFGDFRFENVPAGKGYLLLAAGRRYNFSPQVVEIADTMQGVTITAIR